MADIVMAYIVMARTCEGTQDARRLIQRVTGVGARGQQAHLHRPRVQQLDVLQEPRLQHVRRRVRRQLARRTSKKKPCLGATGSHLLHEYGREDLAQSIFKCL